MCRNCGAIVAAGETACGVCGAPVTQIPASIPQQRREFADRETMRFARAIISRRAPFTIIFCAANVFVFVLMILFSRKGMADSFDYVTLAAFGAKTNELIREGHEWWRFVTPVFIHVNIIHILVNMYGLFNLGPIVEKLYGSAKFVVFWVLTGIAGVAASYFALRPELAHGIFGRFLFHAADVPSAGASGALFGLVGVLFVFGIKYRNELPEGFRRAFGTGMLPTIVINVIIGATLPMIDNAAHMGGLVAGALLALVIDYQRPIERARLHIAWIVLQVAVLALVVASFVMVARDFDASVERAKKNPLMIESGDPVHAFLDAVNKSMEAFENAINKNDTSGVEPAIETLKKTPALDQQSSNLRAQFLDLLARAQTLNAAKTADRATQQARNAERQKLITDYEAWAQKYVEWGNTEGGKFGIKVDKK